MRGARVLASYVAVFALLTAPWLARLTEALPTNTVWARGDTRLLTWILWWVAHALTSAPGTLFDAPINHPAPAQLTLSEHFLALQIPFLPLYEATGNPVLAMNVLLFASYPLAAFAMNRLLAALGFASGVAWVAGFAFALGPLTVPANVHVLHVLAFYLPAVALALRRAREEPTQRRAALLLLLLTLAFFTAYYTTAILLPVILVWSVAELLRPLRARRRFVAIVTGVTLVGLTLLAMISVPYLSRGVAVGSSEAQQLLVRQMYGVIGAYVMLRPVEVFGALLPVLGAIGCCFVLDRRWRWVAALAVVLVATSWFLVSGGPLALVASLPPSGLARALLVPLSFVRIVLRFAVIAGFGLALLVAVALQRAHELLPRRAAIAVLVVVGGAFALERGGQLFGQDVEVSAALTVEAPVYGQLAQVIAHDGGGPLLEMPRSSHGMSLDPEAMLGATLHGQPLIVGHSGYLPPHRPLVDATIKRLPAADAVQELVDTTRLRWLVVRPDPYWAGVDLRRRFVAGLASVPGVRRAAEVDGWSLFAIERPPLDPRRYDAIAHGEPIAGPASTPAPASGVRPR